jgi:DNA replication protein DnaC
MEETMQIRRELKTVLKRMKLSPMLATLPDRVTFAREQKLDFTEFLELVLNDEAERRDQVTIQTRLRNAGFEEKCTLERFDWTANIRHNSTLLSLSGSAPPCRLRRSCLRSMNTQSA